MPIKALVCPLDPLKDSFMIEINQRAKPKVPLHTVAIAMGLHYILNDGIIVLMAEAFGADSLLGRPKMVPADLSFAQNPGIMKENGVYGGLWSKATGMFQGMENDHHHPYHVKSLAGTPWNPAPSIEQLWEHWQGGGVLQWKRKEHGDNGWVVYYSQHDGAHLALSILKTHFAIYDIRKKP